MTQSLRDRRAAFTRLSRFAFEGFSFCPPGVSAFLPAFQFNNRTKKGFMKTSSKTVALASLALALVVPAWSADESFVGKWKAEFDSQVGKQKYTFEFKLEEGKLAGKAIGERQMGTNEVKLVEIKTDKDEISFVEPLRLRDTRSAVARTNEVRIE